MAAIRFSLALLAAGLLSACGSSDEGRQPEPAFDPERMAAKPACEERMFEGIPITACRYDAARDELRLAVTGPGGVPLRSFEALEAALGLDASRVRFAMNAGMYDEQGRPIGLYVEQGEEKKPLNRAEGPGNFHLLPNGVFAIDEEGRPSVTATPDFREEVPNPRWATQSGPMLLIDGKLHPKIDENGTSQLVRNGIAACGPSTAWFAISEAGISFGRFARFFRDALGCKDALYLDGSVSSLWDPAAGRQDPYSELGPMIVVLRR